MRDERLRFDATEQELDAEAAHFQDDEPATIREPEPGPEDTRTDTVRAPPPGDAESE